MRDLSVRPISAALVIDGVCFDRVDDEKFSLGLSVTSRSHLSCYHFGLQSRKDGKRSTSSRPSPFASLVWQFIRVILTFRYICQRFDAVLLRLDAWLSKSPCLKMLS